MITLLLLLMLPPSQAEELTIRPSRQVSIRCAQGAGETQTFTGAASDFRLSRVGESTPRYEVRFEDFFVASCEYLTVESR